MIQFPIIQELLLESNCAWIVELIASLLVDRFGEITPDISATLNQVRDIDKLKRLNLQAARCASLGAFATKLREELSQPRPASTRGKKRKKPD